MATTYSDLFPLNDTTPQDFLSLAVQTCQSLNYSIAFINSTGIIAYMKSGPSELRIHILNDEVNILSRSTGAEWFDRGRNKKIVKSFLDEWAVQRNTSDPFALEQLYTELSVHFVPPESDPLHQPIPSGMDAFKGFLSLFIPRKEFLITPILIQANILFFIVMVIAGADLMQPTNEVLLQWGANFREYTSHGQWWRLISCCFIHIGIFHLLMNMYALLYIGLLLEPILGPRRFLIGYLLTGIAASAASLYWNELTVSAGASGAIFGMYGLFLALLTTKLIEKESRKPMLLSILVFIAYNLVGGVNSHVDNAAHVGGLASGLLIGYLFYPVLRGDQTKFKNAVAIIASVFSIAGITLFLCTHLRGDVGKYIAAMNRLQHLEAEALSVYTIPPNEQEKVMFTLHTQSIPDWKQCLLIVDSCRSFSLPSDLKKRTSLIEEYCRLRLHFFELYEKSLKEKSAIYQHEMNRCNEQIAKKLIALQAP